MTMSVEDWYQRHLISPEPMATLQVTMDQLRCKAEVFRATVRCGESVFRGGRALPAYERTLAVAVAVGRVPPPLPGGWARLHLRLGGAIPDMHAERRLLHNVIFPALRAALLPRRAILEWSDPAWCGPQQAPGAEGALMLHPRLQAFDTGGAARTALTAGDSVLFFCLLLGERAGSVPTPRAIVRSDAGVAVRARVWPAGSAAEADGHQRVAGRERHSVAADVVLPAGEYTPMELAMTLQHALNSAKWDAGINHNSGGGNNVGGGGAGAVAAFRWEWTVENNRLLVTLRGAAMLAFDLSFRLPGLAMFLGFDSGGSVSASSGAVVVVRSESPVRYGSAAGDGWVWAAEAAATALLPTTDERRLLAGRHRVLSDSAWARLKATASSAALEAVSACCLRPRGAEVLVLRRNGAFLAEGRFAAARLAGVVPPSVAAALELPPGPSLGSGSIPRSGPEALVARTLIDALVPPGAAAAGGSAAVQVVEYAAQFDAFHFCHAAVIERVRALFQQAAAASVAADAAATIAAGLGPQALDVEGDSGDLAAVALRLRKECLGWWRLAAEQRTAQRIGCPHGTSGDACRHPSCRALRAVADSPQLRTWDAADTAARQARLGSGPNGAASATEFGHEAAPAAGLELTLGDLGRQAASRLLELFEAYAPAQLLPCQHSINTGPGDGSSGIRGGHGRFAEQVVGVGLHREEVEDAGGAEGAVFHGHALLRARQARVVAGLVEDFVRPHGHTRDRTLSELDRLASGPPTSRPPVVILTGPSYSGRSATLAAFARSSARPAAAGRERRRRPAGALPGLRGAGAGGAADVVAVFFANAEAATAMSPSCCGNGALLAAVEYLATEVVLQLHGGATLSTSGGGAAAAARRLLCINAAEQLADAEERLAAACRAGLQAGARILLLVDGLPPAGLSRLGRLALGLHADAARMCRLAVRHALEGDGGMIVSSGGGGGIQLVATGELVPTELRGDARSVALEPLTRPEREAICRHWLRRHGLLLDKASRTGDAADARTFVKATATAVAAAARLSGLPPTQLQQPEKQVASDAVKDVNLDTDTTGIGNVWEYELEDVVAAIVVKREAHLPLFIAAYAHLAARWALSDPTTAHHPAVAGSSGRWLPTGLAGRLAAAPETVSGLWQRVVLPAAEAHSGRETTR
jgi:hypothetical protein